MKHSKRNIFRSVISSSVGNVLEWYEYTLYAYFATVISALFFPTGDQLVSMMMTFATFAVGLAARPIGGIIFGYIGDKYSRKKMLTFTILLMSIPTMLIGLLPTYGDVGIAAPIMLIALRVLQGMALGGEFGASCVYLYESVPQNKRGFYGCLSLTGVGTGLILSSCTIFIIESIFTSEEVMLYAWRIPFFISVAGSLLGFYMRRNLLETLDFQSLLQAEQTVANPFLEMLKNHKLTLLSLFSIFITTQVAFFVVFIYGKTMMINILHFDSHVAGKYNLITVTSYTIATLLSAYIADKFNRRFVILIGSLGLLIASYPFIAALAGGFTSQILIMSIVMGVLIGITESTLNPVTAGAFPINIRATSVAFCWNFTSVFFGGIAPIITMWLIDKTDSVYCAAIVLMIVSLITATSSAIYLLMKSRSLIKNKPECISLVN